MALLVITIDQKELWNKTIKSFKNYDVNYLREYSESFKLQGEGEPLLFYYDDGSTRAINVVMKRDIALSPPFSGKLPLGTWYDLSTPYGYGGFWIEGTNHDAVNEAYDKYCTDSGFVCEFVRFHLMSDSHSFYNGLVETHTKNVVRALDMPLDEIVMDFEHRARKSLKKSIKAGLEIQIDTNGERLNDFIEVYNGTMDRSNAKDSFYFSKDFFKTLHQMSSNYIYVHILYDEKIISTELVLYGTENCYSFLGGTNQDYLKLQPNSLIKYEIIRWAKEKGLKRFILGGGYGSNDGIYKYKKSFAPNNIYNFYIGKKIFNTEMYKMLVEMRKEDDYNFDEANTFFPLYRSNIT